MIEVWWVTIGDGDYNFDLSHEIRGAKPAAVDHHHCGYHSYKEAAAAGVSL